MASNPRESLRRENISRIDSKNRQSRENGSKWSLAFEEISRGTEDNGLRMYCAVWKRKEKFVKIEF